MKLKQTASFSRLHDKSFDTSPFLSSSSIPVMALLPDYDSLTPVITRYYSLLPILQI